MAQIISITINSILFVLSIVGSGILIWKLNFHNRNSRLLFILYILYWMSPLLCREYTGQMHLHMEEITDYGTLLWVPLISYGIIGLFWRPLSDILAFKLKSRKKVIYMSLLLQIATIIPFLMEPCFATNIVQSIGAGIGASCIGLFNLMFDDQYHHHKVFSTVTIVALPPILAEIITSIYEAFLCSFLPEGEAKYVPYRNVMRFIWVAAAICILASFAVAIFVKEQKSATIYKVERVKEPVKTSHDWWVVILVCLAGACVFFVRWCTAGPTATSQIIFMGQFKESLVHIDVKYFEGYLSLLYAIGSLISMAIAGKIISRSRSRLHMEKMWLIIAAGVLWIAYLLITEHFPYVPVFFFMNFVNGLAAGLVWVIMVEVMMNKHFTKAKYITPIGLFNTFLSIGICLGTFYNNWAKGEFFDFQSWESSGYKYADFVKANREVNFICCFVITAFVVFMIVSFIITKKHPPVKHKVKKLNVIGETEI